MPYALLDDPGSHDIVFHAEGRNLEELFLAAADALLSVLLGAGSELQVDTYRIFRMEDSEPERLLHRFLQELVEQRRTEGILLRTTGIKVTIPEVAAAVESPTDDRVSGLPPRLEVEAKTEGERFDPARHRIGRDVKAISWHRFTVERTPSGDWKATVTLDV